MKVLGTSFGQV